MGLSRRVSTLRAIGPWPPRWPNFFTCTKLLHTVFLAPCQYNYQVWFYISSDVEKLKCQLHAWLELLNDDHRAASFVHNLFHIFSYVHLALMPSNTNTDYLGSRDHRGHALPAAWWGGWGRWNTGGNFQSF